MENNVDFKALGFKPGNKIVRVLKPSGKYDYYNVVYPKGYIARCERDGKKAEYIGMINSKFELI